MFFEPGDQVVSKEETPTSGTFAVIEITSPIIITITNRFSMSVSQLECLDDICNDFLNY